MKKKEDVLRAATYISINRQHQEEQEAHFHHYFIDNFIEGASIFCSSW